MAWEETKMICSKCLGPLEKWRVHTAKKWVCMKCRKKYELIRRLAKKNLNEELSTGSH